MYKEILYMNVFPNTRGETIQLSWGKIMGTYAIFVYEDVSSHLILEFLLTLLYRCITSLLLLKQMFLKVCCSITTSGLSIYIFIINCLHFLKLSAICQNINLYQHAIISWFYGIHDKCDSSAHCVLGDVVIIFKMKSPNTISVLNS